jgi:GNAT superfamily N-acetyltransferase
MFNEYRGGAGLDIDTDVNARLWEWIHRPVNAVSGLVAVAAEGLLGFAHYRRFPRPIVADEGIYLDDLYTRPAARGKGVARLIINHLAETARVGNLGILRWTTNPDNTTARKLYDSLATTATSETYNLTP